MRSVVQNEGQLPAWASVVSHFKILLQVVLFDSSLSKPKLSCRTGEAKQSPLHRSGDSLSKQLNQAEVWTWSMTEK